jgi:hypothetical protein
MLRLIGYVVRRLGTRTRGRRAYRMLEGALHREDKRRHRAGTR